MTNTIGIDLGTSKCCVGVFRDGKVEIIPDEFGNRTTPSYVAFTESERLVGNAAKDQLRVNPANTIFTALRLIGRKFNDATVQSSLKHLPFKVVSAENGRPKVQVEYKGKMKHFYPEEIVAMMLAYLKMSAEAYLNCEVKNAVITVPASFNHVERQSIIDAGTIAGLNVIRIVAASTAAAMAYGFDTKNSGARTILVCDLGGGTLNITIVTLLGTIFEVNATTGEARLGGHDFDNCMVDHFVAEFKKQYGKDITSDFDAISRLRIACICAKHTLSTSKEADFILEDLFDGIDFKGKITRACFQRLCKDLVSKTGDVIKNALQIAQVKNTEIDDILLVGGSSRAPMVQERLRMIFRDRELIKPINRDEMVASGAAIQAALLSGDKSVHFQDLYSIDVAPCVLGIDTATDFVPIVQRGTGIPTVNSKTVTMKYGAQTDILIQIAESAAITTRRLLFRGTLKLNGIPRAPFTETQVKITFDVDYNMNIVATAHDVSTGKSEQISIVNRDNCFTEEEVKHMVDKAAKLKSEERKTTKESLVDYCSKVMQTIEENNRKRKLKKLEEQKINKKCRDAIAWLARNETAKKEELENLRDEVKQVSAGLGNWNGI
uniref:Heat shock protein 70 n=1 Tax=Panagrellus redivivus TaxID=6233 RepID=A0A7E4UVH7_PANRE